MTLALIVSFAFAAMVLASGKRSDRRHQAWLDAHPEYDYRKRTAALQQEER